MLSPVDQTNKAAEERPDQGEDNEVGQEYEHPWGISLGQLSNLLCMYVGGSKELKSSGMCTSSSFLGWLSQQTGRRKFLLGSGSLESSRAEDGGEMQSATGKATLSNFMGL